MVECKVTVDDRDDRVKALYGAETLKAIHNLHVLLVGMRGLGAEIAKNLALAGVGSLSLYDPTLVRVEDLGANFFLREDQVGKLSRTEAVLEPLRRLNPNVDVKIQAGELTEELVRGFSVVVVTELLVPVSRLEKLNLATRNRTGMVLAFNLGLTGTVFTDFGDSHVIKDATGVDKKPCYVMHVTQGNPCVVAVDNESVRAL